MKAKNMFHVTLHVLLLKCLILISVSGFAIFAHAQVDAFEFDTIDQQLRFRKLSNELRCPMCQNTNLTGSTGGVAADLRREVHRMIMDGQTDDEIEQFMFDRYGDFIFYRPRLRAETILLWFGPLIFLLIGSFVAFRILRRAKTTSSMDRQLNHTDDEKLRNLLSSE